MRTRPAAIAMTLLFATSLAEISCSSANRPPVSNAPNASTAQPSPAPQSIPAPQSGPTPLDVAQAGVTPIAIFQPQPPYPAIARNANLTGTVVLEIVVDATGSVISTKLLKSQPPFDRPALETVPKWRYQPLVIDGVPIVWKSKVNLNFRLNTYSDPYPEQDLAVETYLKHLQLGTEQRAPFLAAAQETWDLVTGTSQGASLVRSEKENLDLVERFVSSSDGAMALGAKELVDSFDALKQKNGQTADATLTARVAPGRRYATPGLAGHTAWIDVLVDRIGAVRAARVEAGNPASGPFTRRAIACAMLWRFTPCADDDYCLSRIRFDEDLAYKPGQPAPPAGLPTAAPSVAGTRWQFGGSGPRGKAPEIVTFMEDGTVTFSAMSTGGHWVQHGADLVFDANGFTEYHLTIRGREMTGEWARLRGPQAGLIGGSSLERLDPK